MVLFLLSGCVGAPYVQLPGSILSTDSEVVATQLLRPGISLKECHTRFPWQQARLDEADAVRRMIASVPEANVLRDPELRQGKLHLGVLVRECVSVRGDAARVIGQIRLPPVGHHHHE